MLFSARARVRLDGQRVKKLVQFLRVKRLAGKFRLAAFVVGDLLDLRRA